MPTWQRAVTSGVKHVMQNTGQSCNAPTRMLAPHELMPQVIDIARAAAESTTVGDPGGNAELGPVVSETQWNKIQGLIHKGIEEGAQLVAGGPGRPEGLEVGYYVKPTVFAGVTNDMTIAREEIFGPVIAILGYDTVDEAIRIANDTPYGLAAYVQGKDPAQLRHVASRLRAGQVNINTAGMDIMAPFGGTSSRGTDASGGIWRSGSFWRRRRRSGTGRWRPSKEKAVLS